MTCGSKLLFSKFVAGRKWYTDFQGRTPLFRVRKEIGGRQAGYSKGESKKDVATLYVRKTCIELVSTYSANENKK